MTYCTLLFLIAGTVDELVEADGIVNELAVESIDELVEADGIVNEVAVETDDELLTTAFGLFENLAKASVLSSL